MQNKDYKNSELILQIINFKLLIMNKASKMECKIISNKCLFEYVPIFNIFNDFAQYPKKRFLIEYKLKKNE